MSLAEDFYSTWKVNWREQEAISLIDVVDERYRDFSPIDALDSVCYIFLFRLRPSMEL